MDTNSDTVQDSLPDDIFIDADGWYRWTYYMDRKTNPAYLHLYLKIFALIILIPGAILFFLMFGGCTHSSADGAGEYLAIWMAVLAGTELLTWLIYVLIEKLQGGTTPISYAMNEEMVSVHAENTRTPVSYLETFFSSVRDVRLNPAADEIELCEVLRFTQVYVPRAALPFVLGFILDRVPQTENTEKARREAAKMLRSVRDTDTEQ